MVEIRIVPSKPALIIQGEEKNLIVSDLHIGFENDFDTKEIFLGKNTSTTEMLTDISELIEITKPDNLVLLGDVKSSVKSITKTEWNEIPDFFEQIKKSTEVVLIPGNHDSNIQKLIPPDVIVSSSSGMIIENCLLTHGHTMPSENFSQVNRIIMGHLHPVFFLEGSILNGQRVWVSLKANKRNIFPSTSGQIEITILPSFNKYFYATHKRYYKKSISPLIEKIKETFSARIVTLDGDIIGDESVINQVF